MCLVVCVCVCVCVCVWAHLDSIIAIAGLNERMVGIAGLLVCWGGCCMEYGV